MECLYLQVDRYGSTLLWFEQTFSLCEAKRVPERLYNKLGKEKGENKRLETSLCVAFTCFCIGVPSGTRSQKSWYSYPKGDRWGIRSERVHAHARNQTISLSPSDGIYFSSKMQSACACHERNDLNFRYLTLEIAFEILVGFMFLLRGFEVPVPMFLFGWVITGKCRNRKHCLVESNYRQCTEK